MAYEIEITQIAVGWVEGIVVNPTNEMKRVSIYIEYLELPPEVVVSVGQRLDEVSNLRVGDRVMVRD